MTGSEVRALNGDLGNMRGVVPGLRQVFGCVQDGPKRVAVSIGRHLPYSFSTLLVRTRLELT